jgi:hypothetical protein
MIDDALYSKVFMLIVSKDAIGVQSIGRRVKTSDLTRTSFLCQLR